MTRTRSQKVTKLRDAENKKLSTWLPSNGTGIGLWKGRRVYYVNGKRQSGLTIRNPIGDSIGGGVKKVAKGTLGLAIQGAKDIYGLTKGTSNALLGMASPWNLAAMNRTRRNIAALGVKPKKKLTEKQKLQIAKNEALKIKGDNYFSGDKEITPKQKTKNIIKEEINAIDNSVPLATDKNTVKELNSQRESLEIDLNKLNNRFPAGLEAQPNSSTLIKETNKEVEKLSATERRDKRVKRITGNFLKDLKRPKGKAMEELSDKMADIYWNKRFGAE